MGRGMETGSTFPSAISLPLRLPFPRLPSPSLPPSLMPPLSHPPSLLPSLLLHFPSFPFSGGGRVDRGEGEGEERGKDGGEGLNSKEGWGEGGREEESRGRLERRRGGRVQGGSETPSPFLPLSSSPSPPPHLSLPFTCSQLTFTLPPCLLPAPVAQPMQGYPGPVLGTGGVERGVVLSADPPPPTP